MTFVKFNPELVQAFINDLDSYVHAVDSERSDIHRASEDNGHPVPQVGEATRYPALFVDGYLGMDVSAASDMATVLAALIEVADDLAARRREIIDLNSSGVTAAAPDGSLTYYLPDDAEDTITNLRSYNTEAATAAGADAAALTQAKNSENGTADDGRTTDQILTDITNHQDNPAYGAAFIKAAGGAQAYLDLVYEIDRASNYPYKSESAVTTLGHVLGAASQPEVGGDDLGAQFASVIVQTPSADRTAVFNALTSQSEVVYGTGFLTSAADGLMGLDPVNVHGGTSYLSTQYSHDPMAGVLTAMGNNPRAALDYLGGDGHIDGDGNWVPDDKAQWRWERLTSRNWGCDYMMPGSDKPTAADGLTAALAAASSFHNPAPADDGTLAKDAARDDAKAAYASARGIMYFGGESVSKNDMTTAMQRNLAVVLANCPEEVIATANGTDTSYDGQFGGPAFGPSVTDYGVSTNNISTLIYRIGSDKDAVTTMSAGVGDQFGYDLAARMKEGNEPPATILGDQYQSRAATGRFIERLVGQRFTDDGADSEQDEARSKAVVDTGLSVATTVGAAALAAATDGAGAPALGYAVSSTIAKPLVADELSKDLGISDPSLTGGSEEEGRPGTLAAQAYGDALRYGLLGEGTVGKARNNQTGWYSEDVDGKPTMQSSASLSSDQLKEIGSWAHYSGDPEFGKLNSRITDGRSGCDGLFDNEESRDSYAPISG